MTDSHAFPTNMKPKDLRNPYADYRVDDLSQFLSGYTLPRDPGSEFEYSNLGGDCFDHLLAYRAGTDYESLIWNSHHERQQVVHRGAPIPRLLSSANEIEAMAEAKPSFLGPFTRHTRIDPGSQTFFDPTYGFCPRTLRY
jgi:hypothetical protein